MTREDAPWAPSGHELGRAQRLLALGTAARPRSETATEAAVIGPDGGVTVGGVELDSGGILRRLLGHDVREAGIAVWRAPTENDREAGEEFGYGDETIARAAALAAGRARPAAAAASSDRGRPPTVRWSGRGSRQRGRTPGSW